MRPHISCIISYSVLHGSPGTTMEPTHQLYWKDTFAKRNSFLISLPLKSSLPYRILLSQLLLISNLLLLYKLLLSRLLKKKGVTSVSPPPFWMYFLQSTTIQLGSKPGEKKTDALSLTISKVFDNFEHTLVTLWWLIGCINLTGRRHAQIVNKTSFLGMFVRMFPGEVSIWISKLSEDHPHQCRVGLI